MKAHSLQFKLLLLVTVALGLPLAAALISLARVYSSAEQLERISRQDFQAQEIVLRATIRFKQQVQEWKDVLLRGSDPAALEKYWNNFQAREADTRNAVLQARDAIAYEDLRTKLDEFLAAHQAAGERYRAGFAAFKAAQFDPHAGDVAVAGIDRPPTELLLQAEKVARERGALAVAQAVGSAQTAFRLAIGTTLVVVGVALVLLWLFIRHTMVEPIREAMRFASRIAEGDLTGEIRARSRDEVGQLQDALAKMNGSLTAIVRQMSSAAESVAVASGQVASGATSLSQQTEEQASSLEETAASMEELSTTVQQNAGNAEKADKLARHASDAAQAGGVEVRNVVGTMAEITGDSKRIGEIVAMIDAIAFQTNILALNAAVEAARAGEQGRGFAVVASEVRVLAQRSAEAAREIKALIGRSSQKVQAGATLVERAAGTIERLVDGVREVSGLMSSIAEASGEQARGVQQINKTVTEMDKVVQHTASAVHESASAAEGMRRQAEEMVRTVNSFRLPEGAASKPASSATLAARAVQSARVGVVRPSKQLAVPAATDDWEEF